MYLKLENYINGKFQSPAENKYIKNVNPVNGKTISMIPESTNADINLAVEAATQALARPDWNHFYISQRKRSEWCSRIADGIESRLEEFAQAESLDTGNASSSLYASFIIGPHCYQ